jgi:hypothetical protein
VGQAVPLCGLLSAADASVPLTSPPPTHSHPPHTHTHKHARARHRSFLARPLLSDDGQGADKHKMDRFAQPGRSLVGSVYAPISYPPLPLLAFKVRTRGWLPLRVTGCQRGAGAARAVS